MKQLITLITRKHQVQHYDKLNRDNGLSKPKALIIKMEDLSSKILYKEICKEGRKNINQSFASDWYVDNRHHCIEYLTKACEQFQLKENTYFAALSYVDRILKSSPQIMEKDFDMIIIGCFLLAAKYVENDAYEINLYDFYSLNEDNLYVIDDIKKGEVQCIQALNYELNEASPYDYLSCQIGCGVIFKDEVLEKNDVNKFYTHTKKVLAEITSSVLGLVYSPEVIALCVIYLSRNHFEYDEKRMKTIKGKLHFSLDKEFEELLHDLNE